MVLESAYELCSDGDVTQQPWHYEACVSSAAMAGGNAKNIALWRCKLRCVKNNPSTHHCISYRDMRSLTYTSLAAIVTQQQQVTSTRSQGN
jgi:hypothetical protein